MVTIFSENGNVCEQKNSPVGYPRSVSSADDATGELSPPRRYTPAQRRTIETALGLFAEHGVGGTSLQMIANALGVTKAAVYHQFRTKDEIILAVAEAELAGLEVAIEAAETEESGIRGRQILLAQVIDMAVRRRRLVGVLQNDPVMVRLLAAHEPFGRLIERLFTVLAGADGDTDMRVQAAMMAGAIGGAALHPVAADLDDDTLRRHLMDLTRRLFQLP